MAGVGRKEQPQSSPDITALDLRTDNHHATAIESGEDVTTQSRSESREETITARVSRGRGRRPNYREGSRQKAEAAVRLQVSKDTLKALPAILDAAKDRSLRQSDKFKHEDFSALQTDRSSYPDFLNTQVKVVNKDTLDTALALDTAGDIMETKDRGPVCVLNFANAFTRGGGWLKGSRAQEEQICYRSSLIESLHARFYPMQPKEFIYSSEVIIFRENEAKGYSWMWTEKPDILPIVSVISLAAKQDPPLDETEKKYENPSQRIIMESHMRTILRVAAENLHRRLVLGALGVLREKEFKGWFETIVFAVLDWPKGVNFPTFRDALHNLQI
ncbi:uncharacterized protein N7482_003844 [Penicillium canariense]|uniref:Microbial-type PARG catalytic domain-containing protein n=1 Tax=Penicillium canariense TaxID=189055 RepID=A0A9W9LPQ0_9EURO|nr:uncharacterized protein N7482_003844 [Penicillium canariense]KAJ5168250.1 hypothetical protein N7482_003844 [Penicillium canariense]